MTRISDVDADWCTALSPGGDLRCGLSAGHLGAHENWHGSWFGSVWLTVFLTGAR